MRRPVSTPTLLDTVLVGVFMISGAALAIQGVRGARVSFLWVISCAAIGLLLQMVQPRAAEGRPLPQ
jgi:hypothetical protein